MSTNSKDYITFYDLIVTLTLNHKVIWIKAETCDLKTWPFSTIKGQSQRSLTW